ncbi:MAG: Asp-tRNA(Asn)/Glu-tRNA(Gln) amidotransferase subunit GatA [Synergistetes bacterium]|nr:Asp-tRNA(Asn)/Glu-tRNA(Gln) amidotransferase subunit GatA [Synergistota bacterium]
MELFELPAWKLGKMMESGEVTAVEVVESVLSRIEEREEILHCYNEVYGEEALQEAEEIDKRRKGGEKLPPFAGIPVAVKDNICVKGKDITCSSKILKGFISPYDATVIRKIKSQKMIIIGRTNMDEFAMGSSTENSAYGVTRNPLDTSKVPGGSSGGSAAAVASGEAIVALGSDTGGSIRQPAAFCGVVGFKPTYGLVSRYGLIAFASSLDQIGPITKDVRDAAAMLEIIAGKDNYDSTSLPVKVPHYSTMLEDDISEIRVGIMEEYNAEGVSEEVIEGIEEVIDIFRTMRVNVKSVSFPHMEYALPCYYIIAPAEASSNLARYDGVQYGISEETVEDIRELYRKVRTSGFGKEVKRRIMMGTYVLSSGYYDAFYLKAQKVRTLIRHDFERAFKDVDVIIGPTSPTVAFGIGERTADPISMYLSDIFTIPANLAGISAISIPLFKDGNLPVGIHIVGKALGEIDILKVSYKLEQELKERGLYHGI